LASDFFETVADYTTGAATSGTRPLHLWRSWGPSVFGLLQLAVIFSLGTDEFYSAFSDLAEFKGRREYREESG